jgi:cytochrome c553
MALTRMKLPFLLASSSLALVIASGSALAADAKPPFKPDPAKGGTIAASCQACHAADGSRGRRPTPSCKGSIRNTCPSNWPSSSRASATTPS